MCSTMEKRKVFVIGGGENHASACPYIQRHFCTFQRKVTSNDDIENVVQDGIFAEGRVFIFKTFVAQCIEVGFKC